MGCTIPSCVALLSWDRRGRECVECTKKMCSRTSTLSPTQNHVRQKTERGCVSGTYSMCVSSMCTWKHESDLYYKCIYVRMYMCKCVLVHEVSVDLQEQSMRVVLTSAKRSRFVHGVRLYVSSHRALSCCKHYLSLNKTTSVLHTNRRGHIQCVHCLCVSMLPPYDSGTGS